MEAHINLFAGGKDDLIEELHSIARTDRSFILAKEKDVTYPPDTKLIDADTYGLYYALNDHYSRSWDSKGYKLLKNGAEGNPLITNLLKVIYEDDNGSPRYKISDEGYVEKIKGMHEVDCLRDELFKSFEKHDTEIFSDLKLAFVGGSSITYYEIVLKLAHQFRGEGFLNFSPAMYAPPLDMRSANYVQDQAVSVDYVVTSNVLNSFEHHLENEKRDEVFACCAKILEKGGKAIHVMEKTTRQEHFNVNLNRSMHKHIGQDLIYSFYREEGAMDRYIEDTKKGAKDMSVFLSKIIDVAVPDERKRHYREKLTGVIKDINEDNKGDFKAASLQGKSDDFRTSLLVMYQTKKPYITKESIQKMKMQANNYRGRSNYYHKPVYIEKPGLSME